MTLGDLFLKRRRALTLAELVFLNRLHADERARKEQQMVAKIGGLARFISDVKSLDADGSDMADAIEALLARKERSKAALLDTVAGANEAFDVVDQLTAAFGSNGGPSSTSAAALAKAAAAAVEPVKQPLAAAVEPAAAPATAETETETAPATPANPQ